ncbi:MAG: response regulator [Candidatus Aureabacteria bacterium]|nr:response regulator [Candidatus Auribacterota bacterium]
MSKNILIIEDEIHQRTVLRFDMNKIGFSTFEAETGEKGIEIAALKKVDVIILDIMLPDIDGFEVCRRLKSHEKTKDIPVIVLTALFQQENINKAKECGVAEYIVKPYNFEYLHQTIVNLVGRPL